MATGEVTSAFTAFESQLKTLCLHEFPCGIGLWSENHGKSRKHIAKNRVNSRFVVTLKDFGADYEKTETLEELVVSKTSPWNADYSWSGEAKQLREIAVRSPWLIDEQFVLSHFKTLRIVDKQVTEVDELLKKFTKLKELSLSANKLRTVNSRNLPPSLQVLELCANQISNLADLCIRTPPLIHLGLGYNSITLVDDYITGEYWPNLLSLDMGHNNLTDMMDIVRKLATLPKLRNLILHGNPLALVPSYRGYTIDSLKRLNFLDDISISADERHHFKGLSKKKEYILDEVKVTLKVNFMKNIPMPEELKNPEEQPEFPVITKKYFVRFQFPEDKATTAEVFQIIHDDDFTHTPSESQVLDTERGSQPSMQGTSQEENGAAEEKAVSFAEGPRTVSIMEPETVRSDMPTEVAASECGGSLDDVDDARSLQLQMEIKGGSPPELVLAPIDSTPVVWAEDMEVAWVKTISRDDLLGFRNFLKEGMDIYLMEEKVCSFPADQVEGTATPDGSRKGGDKKKDDKKKEEKGKDAKSAAKGGDKDKAGSEKDKKKGKKKKVPTATLR